MGLREEVRRLTALNDHLERDVAAKNVERQTLIELVAVTRNDRDRLAAFIALQQERHTLGLGTGGWISDIDQQLARVRREAGAAAVAATSEEWLAGGIYSADPKAWVGEQVAAIRRGDTT